MSEFALIQRYFTQPSQARPAPKWLVQGIGDDTARVACPENHIQSLSIDTLVAGVHFSHDDDPRGIGHKSLAVGLSDLAASGATPAWASLALTLPEYDEAWLESFSQGFFDLAKRHNVHLIGGDTTRGPLSISVQVAGWLPCDKGLTRFGAQVGDTIYATGKMGAASLALKCAQQQRQPFSEWLGRLHFPQPRVSVGQAILERATAAVDVSDGLLADLQHILDSSGVGASLKIDAIPRVRQRILGLDEHECLRSALCGGDDYELLFCSSAAATEIEQVASETRCSITAIGTIEKLTGLRCDLDGLTQAESAVVNDALTTGGYRHF